MNAILTYECLLCWVKSDVGFRVGMFLCSIKTGRWGSVSQRYISSSFTFFLWLRTVGLHSIGLRPSNQGYLKCGRS
jgi:hypothetical protein